MTVYPIRVYNLGSDLNELRKKCVEIEEVHIELKKKKIIRRLNIIEGQIRGIDQMIKNDRYFNDVLI